MQIVASNDQELVKLTQHLFAIADLDETLEALIIAAGSHLTSTIPREDGNHDFKIVSLPFSGRVGFILFVKDATDPFEQNVSSHLA